MKKNIHVKSGCKNLARITYRENETLTGYIKLHRDLLDDPIYLEERFSKGQAWIDLLFQANFKDKKLVINNQIVVVPRGSFITSIHKLSKRWQWSVNTVKKFLDMLAHEQMITRVSTNHYTRIDIVNYAKYQDKMQFGGTQIDTQSDTQSDTHPDTHPDTHCAHSLTPKEESKERKESKEGKEIKNIYGEYRHVRLTMSERSKLIQVYGEEFTDKCIKFLDEYIEMTGKKYKSHYLAIRKWVLNAVREEEHRNNKTTGNIDWGAL